MKKIISVITCIMLLLAALPVFPAQADETPADAALRIVDIENIDDLEALAEGCVLDSYSKDLKAVLKNDLDLAGQTIQIPLFAGEFDGNGHKITGLSINEAASTDGLFRIILEGGLVKDLGVSGQISPEGSAEKTGGIAGENRGTIENCSFDGDISGSRYVGGIAGVNAEGAVISGSIADGTIDGQHCIGGIAGENHGAIEGCKNNMRVNGKVPEPVTTEGLDLSLSAEEVIDITDVGGIAGYSDGQIRDCSNDAEIGYNMAGYNIGGIAGHLAGYIYNCTNEGKICGRKDVGGIAGQIDPDTYWSISEDKLKELEEKIGSLQDHIDTLVRDADSESKELSGDLSRMVYAIGNTESAAKRLAQEAASWANDSISAVNDLSGRVSTALSDLSGISGQISQTTEGISGLIEQIEAAVRETSETAEGDTDALNEFLEQVQIIRDANAEITSELNAALEAVSSLSGSTDDPEKISEIADIVTTNITAMLDARTRVNDALSVILGIAPKIVPEGTDPESIIQAITDAENISSNLIPLFNSVTNMIDNLREGGRISVSPISGNAGEDLFNSLGNMNSILNSLSGSVGGSSLSQDIQGVSDEFFDMVNFLMEALESDENTGTEKIEDISLFDSGRTKGTIDKGNNAGDVTAQTNAGGIVGAITIELSFDLEDELDISNILSEEAKYLIYARVKDSSSCARIHAERDAAGGIAGRMDYGALTGCSGSGTVNAQGQYSGGICGLSDASISLCSSFSVISAGSYSGGIAGSGYNIYDCLSMPYFPEKTEFQGSICGYSEGTLSGNYYAGSETGGSDGFSFAGQSQEITIQELLERSHNADVFTRVTVRFEYEDEILENRTVEYGSSVTDLPELPDKDGKYWKWDSDGLDNVIHDITVKGEYVRPLTVISTGEEIPAFLAEGVFTDDQKISVSDYQPDALPDGVTPERILDKYTVSVGGALDELTLRMHESEEGTLYVVDSDGNFYKTEYTRDGSYIVFNLPNGGSLVYCQNVKLIWPFIVTGAAAAVLIAGLIVFIVLRKKSDHKHRTEN